MAEDLEEIKQAVVEGRYHDIGAMVQAVVDKGVSPLRIMEALRSAMNTVGQLFESGEFYVPEMMVAATAMKEGLKVIKPLLKGVDVPTQGRVIMATVHGDIHDIGKNLVIMMLESAGFEVIDLGVEVSATRIVKEVSVLKPDILGMSALLSTTMHEMRRVIDTLDEKGLRKNLKIMVGGAPVDGAFARSIGADGYATDAAQAVRLALDFMNKEAVQIEPDLSNGGPDEKP